MGALYQFMLVALLLSCVNSENSTLGQIWDACEIGAGPWSLALEDWATSAQTQSDRNGRIMALAPSQGYYVTERIDTPMLQPPPPPPLASRTGPPAPTQPSNTPSAGLKSNGYKMPQQGHRPQSYNEWEGTPIANPGKIVNKPAKDKFRPSYPLPSGVSKPYGNGVDRVDELPQKQVSETDLYLLSAIEKLVYRADLTEKRLRKLEESLHYLVAGADKRPEACGGGNFTRVGRGCYWWSRDTADWKDASRACRRHSAALLELPHREDARALISALLADKQLAGYDFWTGGLNPGLLWIWSNSARPIQSNGTDNATVTITGDGRCLALAHEPALRSYMYRGQDCGFKHRYICQMEEDVTKLGNEIEKTAKMLRNDNRQARELLRKTEPDSSRR